MKNSLNLSCSIRLLLVAQGSGRPKQPLPGAMCKTTARSGHANSLAQEQQTRLYNRGQDTTECNRYSISYNEPNVQEHSAASIHCQQQAAQFIAGGNIVPTNSRSLFHTQTLKRQQALQENVCLLNGNIGSWAAMVPIAKAHEHRRDRVACERPPWAQFQRMLANHVFIRIRR